MNVKYGCVHLWDVASAPYFSVYIPQYTSHKDMTHKSNRQKTHRRLCVTSPSWEAPWRSTWAAFTKPALGCLRAASCGRHSNCFDGLELMFLSDLMSDGNTDLVAAASNSFSRPFCPEKSEVIVKGGGIHVKKKKNTLFSNSQQWLLITLGLVLFPGYWTHINACVFLLATCQIQMLSSSHVGIVIFMRWDATMSY